MKICGVCDLCFDDNETTCHEEFSESRHSVDAVAGYRIERAMRCFCKTSIFQARNLEYRQECLLTIAEGNTERFLADAKRASRLFHPHVASVIESGLLSDGSAYAIAESFEGDSLGDLIEYGSLSLLDQIIVARQTAEAVHAIHAAGLIHSAIRPENIAVIGVGSGELTVKLHNLDLGSSIADEILANRFAMEPALDVVRYYAPERLRNEPVTAQSEVYSLGLLLYELLSGHQPFDADSATALIDQHLNERPPEIKIENFDLRMLLTHTLSESLQKQPSFRQSTADLFARQMRHIEQLATHVPTPPPAVAVATAKRKSIPQRAVRPRVAPVSVTPAVEPEPLVIAEPAAVKIAATAIEQPLPFVPAVPKRSRLKGMKRRLQSHLADAKTAPETKPALIEWNQPEDDIPSVEAMRNELAKVGKSLPVDVDEEITPVRPHVDRIEIDWTKTKSIDAAAQYVPTLVAKRSLADEPQLLGYQSRGFDVGKLPIYGVALFGFVLVAFGVIRIGSALADNSEGYIGETRRSPVVVSAPPPRYSPPIEVQPAVLNVPEQPVESPASIDVDRTTMKESPDAGDKVIEPAKPAMSKRSTAEEAKSEPAVVRQNTKAEDPIVPSTLVITRGGQRPRAVVVTDSTDRETRSTRPGSGATRPRVVNLPD